MDDTLWIESTSDPDGEAAGCLDAGRERVKALEARIRADERQRIVAAVSALQRTDEMRAFMERHALHRRCGPEHYIVSLAAEISRMGDS